MHPSREFLGRLFPDPRYYGWVVVGLGFLCSALSSPGQSFALSLYLESVIADLGLSRVELSSIYAAATLLAAGCLPVVGRLADRLPSGRYLAGVLGLLGVSMLGLSVVGGAASLAVAFFLLRLLGQGAIGLGTLTVTVEWFHRYRARALGMVGLGYALGQIVFPGVIYGLIEWVGWRGSLVALGVLYLTLFAPLMGRLVRSPRESDRCETHLGRPGDQRETEISYPVAEVVRMPVFWGMLLCLAVPPFVSTAVVFHQVALFGSLGWAPALVPAAFMAYAIASVVMTYATSIVLESAPTRLGVSASLGLSVLALGSMLLPLPPVVASLVYGTLLGLASGAQHAAGAIVWPDYFGTSALGAVKGVVNGVINGATALGPPVAALLLASTGSFSTSLILFALLSTVAAVSALFLRPPGARVRDLDRDMPFAGPLGGSAQTGRAA